MTKAKLFENIKIVALICGLMVAVHMMNVITGGYFRTLGVQPRDISSLYSIILYPWIHGDINHLLSNLSIMAILSFLCLLQGPRYFIRASAIIIILSGALLWLFGRGSIHIGASGWIFGLWSLTIALAWFERSPMNIIIGIGVIFFYGGLIFGLLPTSAPVSVEGHIFGALSGIFAAGLLSKQRRIAPARAHNSDLKFWS